MSLRKAAAIAAACLLSASAAHAQDRQNWVADEVEAAAILPAPRTGDKVTGATLSCAAQRWTLKIVTAATDPLASGPAVLKVDGSTFELAATSDAGTLTASVPKAALEPLRHGVSMTLDFTGELEEAIGDLAFSLRGSRVAIDAAAARCTLRDMTGYTPVTFTPYSSYLNLVRELRAGDIAAFAQATLSQPAIEAAMVEFGGDRRILFTRMCGSSWYFGASRCNVTGYAPTAGEVSDEAQGWHAVYDSENVHIFTDPRVLDEGWPALATLPAGPDGTARLWRWGGTSYALVGELPEDEPLALRTGGN